GASRPAGGLTSRRAAPAPRRGVDLSTGLDLLCGGVASLWPTDPGQRYAGAEGGAISELTGRSAARTEERGDTGLVRRLVSVPPGARLEGAAGSGGELWFVIRGEGLLDAGELRGTPLGRDTGLWLPPGARYRLQADPRDEILLDAVALPAQVSAASP